MKIGARGIPRVAAGLADQAVIACANAATTILGLALLDRDRAGGMVLSLGLGYLVLTLGRAFVGDVLVALAARLDGERRERLVRNGLATAVTLGTAAALILLVVWVVRPRTGPIDLQDLIWLVPFLPAVLLHDTGRSSYLANREQSKALVIDLVWVSCQAAAMIILIMLGVRTAGAILACWGLGALAGALVFLARSRAWPWRGNPRHWLGETRHLSGWFTATQIIGQIQVQAVGFIVGGRLSQADLSGLRGGQTALIQPVQNFNTAVQSLIVPRLSRLAGDAATQTGAAGQAAELALRRQIRQLSLAFFALALALVATLVPLARYVLTHISKFADIAPLALPLAVQAGIYLVELPFAAALRGMHRARLLFVRYVIYTVASLTGLVIGADADGLHGSVWGLTVGAAVSLLVMVSFYLYAARRMSTAPDEAVAEEAVPSTDEAVPAVLAPLSIPGQRAPSLDEHPAPVPQP